MAKPITKKQFIKRKTNTLATMIHQALTGEIVSVKEALKSFPYRSYFKLERTGEIRLGLSLRGINRLVKKYPEITPEQVMELYNVTPANKPDPTDV